MRNPCSTSWKSGDACCWSHDESSIQLLLVIYNVWERLRRDDQMHLQRGPISRGHRRVELIEHGHVAISVRMRTKLQYDRYARER